MGFEKITEKDSLYNNLHKMSTEEIINNIHKEDQKAVKSINKVLPKISILIDKIFEKLNKNGRLFYIGAGTSGRLGVLDASECPPTFGTNPGKVIGIIAGGDFALRNSIENSEDDELQAWKDLQKHKISKNDFVIGIAASGTTPYVVSGIRDCKKNQISTACITCNPKSPLSNNSDYPIEIIVGPEFLTGSSRMKAGTIQKLILNMISTAVMIKLGHVKGNKMIDMQLSNNKLYKRGVKILMRELNIDKNNAEKLINKYKSVRESLSNYFYE